MPAKLYDDSDFVLPTEVTFLQRVYPGAQIMAYIIIVVIFGFFYTIQPPRNTAFPPGVETGVPAYNIVPFQIWTLCVAAIIGIIAMKTVAFGETKQWTGTSLVGPPAAIFVIGVAIGGYLLVYGYNANVSGHISLNPASDPHNCGIQAIIDAAENNCENTLPESPVPVITGWNPRFTWFGIMSILLGVFLFLMWLRSLTDGNAIKWWGGITDRFATLSATFQRYTNKVAGSVGVSLEDAGIQMQPVPVETEFVNNIQRVEFNDLIGRWARRLYPTVSIIDLLIFGILLCVWFGWYQQDADNWSSVFVQQGSNPWTVLQENFKSVVNAVFYILMAFVPIVWWERSYLCDFTYNWRARWVSLLGLALDVCLAVFWIVFYVTANQNGSSNNIGNDILFCCARQLTPVFVEFRLNPLNKCPNSGFPCTEMIDQTKLKLNPKMWVLGALILIDIILNIVTFIFAWREQAELDKHRPTTAEQDRRDEALQNAKIEAVSYIPQPNYVPVSSMAPN